jgi:hypothetical protein
MSIAANLSKLSIGAVDITELSSHALKAHDQDGE